MDCVVSDTLLFQKLKSFEGLTPTDTIGETSETGAFYARLGSALLTTYVIFITFTLAITRTDTFLHLVVIMTVIEVVGLAMIRSIAYFLPLMQVRNRLDLYDIGLIVKDMDSDLAKAVFLKDNDGHRIYKITMLPRKDIVFFPNKKHTAQFFVDGEYLGSFDSCYKVMEKLNLALNTGETLKDTKITVE